MPGLDILSIPGAGYRLFRVQMSQMNWRYTQLEPGYPIEELTQIVYLWG